MRDSIETAAKTALAQFLSPSLLKSAAAAICDELVKQLTGAAPRKPGRPKKGASAEGASKPASAKPKATAKAGKSVDRERSFAKSVQWAKKRAAEGNPKPGDEEILAAAAEGKIISVAAARARAGADASEPKRKPGRPRKASAKPEASAEASTPDAETPASESETTEVAPSEELATVLLDAPANGASESGSLAVDAPL